jgi:hypothetical protein
MASSYLCFANLPDCDQLGFVFGTRASREFRQITAEPSAACDRCSSPELSHSSNAGRSKFEISPASSSAIISPSTAHIGHLACLELRPRRINKESVSIVIFVFFAINLLSEAARVLKPIAVSSLAVSRKPNKEA